MESVSIVTPKRGKKRLGQNISRDPINKQWANDKEKFGLKMMVKMGWTEGKGLGANEDGMTDYIKAKKLKDREGLGVTVETRNDWDVNNRDLDDIFVSLNANHVPVQKESASESDEEVEENKVSIPRHLIVQKRHRAKNVRNYSKTDLAAILGVKPESSNKKPETDEQFESDVPTITASEDIFEHFRKMSSGMCALPDENDNSIEDQNDDKSSSESEEKKLKGDKKREKKEKKEKKRRKQQEAEEQNEESDSEHKKQKKDKKKKKQKHKEVVEEEVAVEEGGEEEAKEEEVR